MSLLSALFVLATPLFGFSLTPPAPSALALPVHAQLDATADVTADATADVSADQASEPADRADSAPGADFESMGAALRERQALGTIHRAFGIATWASMLVTVALGFIQYYNLYGFFGSLEDTPCVQGNAVFGQDQCWGEPWPHRIAAMTTTALYTTTFILPFVMPDPLGASEGPSGENLRIHKALRWVHLGGMIAQVLMGFMVGQNWFGLDRANDFGAMQAIATAHQVIGLTTFGALTAAGALMIF